MRDDLILVTGAGGFIGGSMVAEFRRQGCCRIRAVDIKPFAEWFQFFPDVENLQLDLKLIESCRRSVRDVSRVYNFAADMGGIGFIENNKALCMLSVLINTYMLQAAQEGGVARYFYSSSACVYPHSKQSSIDATGLKEEDAYPANPQDGYGWEKLFSERMCGHFREEFGLETRVSRFHNVYGPFGTWDRGRDKACAAICRKIIHAKVSGRHEIEIWGDGTRTRSFIYIDDCIKGVQLIMNSNILEPVNLGTTEMVSVNQLVGIVEDIAGIRVKRVYDLDAPKGVMGRNSDNTLIKRYLNWEPDIPLRTGLEKTYAWIYDQYMARENSRKTTVVETA
jgi:nucleoside-diphosphate-sugar epimerase